MSDVAANVDEETAFHFIVRCLREEYKTDASNYGYDLFLPHIVDHYLRTVLGRVDPKRTREPKLVSPPFMNAAWELARRGILRPGTHQLGLQVTSEGCGGGGFSVTSAGRKWLQESGQYEFVPIDPGRFAKQLASFTSYFGSGFGERSQEAIRCYGALAYLACCAMCGAAAESVALAIASAKSGDATKVEKLYFATGGRGRIEKLILGGQPSQIQEEFRGYMSLLKYWRDAAAHGHRTGIGDSEAFTALAVLMRFANFASDRWKDFTGAD